MVQKFTENDKKPELMGKVVIINPVSLRRKKKKKDHRFPILQIFTTLLLPKNVTSLPHPRKGNWVYSITAQICY